MLSPMSGCTTPGKSLDKYEKRLGVGTDTKELKPLQRLGL